MTTTSRAPITKLIWLGMLLVISLMVVLTGPQPAANAYPPDVPSKAQVQTELNGLTVRAEASESTYDREKFPHWSTVSGSCDTRETVLKRDGSNVNVGSDCRPTSGSWFSEYDGVTVKDSSDIDIDHIVPLAEAWRSGASAWTTDRREDFANDLDGPQLIAVTASSNRTKSDQDPTEWMPTVTSKHCAYAKFWIHTKHRWNLTLQSAEKTALQTALNTCSY